MSRKPYGFIYITENNINGKKYIGQKKFDGWNWERYMGSGTILKQAINKYGVENFTRRTIDLAYDCEELNELEKYYIKQCNAVNSPSFYNLAVGGDSKDALNIYNSKKLICISNGKWFKSYSDAQLYSGLSKSEVKQSLKRKHTTNFKNESLIFRDMTHVRLNKNICYICGKNFEYKDRNYCGFCNDVHDNLDALKRNTQIKGRMCGYDAQKDNSVGLLYINKYIKENLDSWALENKETIEGMFLKDGKTISEISKTINLPYVKMNEIKYILGVTDDSYIPNFKHNAQKDLIGNCSICAANIVMKSSNQKYCKYCRDKHYKI